VIAGQEMPAAIADLPLSEETRAALLGVPNRQRAVLNLSRALERSQWAIADQILGSLHLKPGQVQPLYLEAITWGNRIRDVR